MSRSVATGADVAFAPTQTLLLSARARSSAALALPPRQRLRGTRFTAPPHASVSLDKEAAVRAAKRVYKAAKAEYKARKAEYKALKVELETLQEPVPEDERRPPVVANPVAANPVAVDAAAVCEGKACCRMGADAVAMLLGKQTLRVPCMKKCGGAGPSVRFGNNVVKVDLKKAITDAIPVDAKEEGPPKSPSPSIQTNGVLELLGERC